MIQESKNRDFKFTVRPLTPEDGGGYLCEVIDYPGCSGDGATAEDAIKDAELALAAWKATAAAPGSAPGPPAW